MHIQKKHKSSSICILARSGSTRSDMRWLSLYDCTRGAIHCHTEVICSLLHGQCYNEVRKDGSVAKHARVATASSIITRLLVSLSYEVVTRSANHWRSDAALMDSVCPCGHIAEVDGDHQVTRRKREPVLFRVPCARSLRPRYPATWSHA